MKSSFQTILIIVFIVGFVGAVAVFSGLFSSTKTSTSTAPSGVVYAWGILPREQMNQFVDNFNAQDVGYSVVYDEHSPETFTTDLINALADGNPPDVVIFSSEIYSQFKDKLYTIPYAAYSERAFRDTNIDGAQLFLNAQGTLALPLLVDPLVVYYNKDILNATNFVVPPATWDTLAQSVRLFTKRNAQNAIIQSTIGLGDPDNVVHMRDILSALFLQSGNSIVAYDATLGRNVTTLTDGSVGSGSAATLPTAQALEFYASFENPTNTNYSWNRSLPDTLQSFLAGKSAFYIGRASELFSIQAQNPSLNFDVKELFQSSASTRPITFGSYVAAGVITKGANFNAGYAFASYLASKDSIDALSKSMSLPPVRRDLLQVQQQNPYVSVFFKAALSAFSWPDPNAARTEDIFRAMINNINSGRTDSQDAIYEAARDLQSTIK